MLSEALGKTMLALIQGEALAMAMLDDETMIQARNTRDVEHICKHFTMILLETFFLRSAAPM